MTRLGEHSMDSIPSRFKSIPIDDPQQCADTDRFVSDRMLSQLLEDTCDPDYSMQDRANGLFAGC